MSVSSISDDRQPFVKRIVAPVSIVFGIWLITTLIYNHSWRFLDASVHRPLAVVCALLMGTSIIFGTVLIYPLTLRRRASLLERTVACYFTPLAWMIKELTIIAGIYSAAETLFYVINPLFMGVLSLTLIEMGIADIVTHRLMQRRQKAVAAATFRRGPTIAIVFGLIALYFFMVWGNRVGYWYLHQDWYQFLFLP
jgi:hypothetical protein